ncbi:hypothetical protein QZN31_27820, partial [Burkholderia multivorans]|nr:hypothetical protein [Burkholderia multivorans]
SSFIAWLHVANSVHARLACGSADKGYGCITPGLWKAKNRGKLSGASLTEAVVPVLVARLDTAAHAELRKVVVELSYKNGAKRITTLLPVIEVTLVSDDMFTQDMSVEILLEAQDSKGNVVGEPRPGGDVNPATRTVTLLPNQRKQIALRMDEDFRGKFKVLALNPTTLAAYSNLALETDYTE